MDQFIWRKIKEVTVPDFPEAYWTPALDFLIPNRLYRFRVKANNKWQLEGAENECTADGYAGQLQKDGDTLCAEAPFGALIGKVGGGTADRTGEIFGVGRYCIYKILVEPKAGPLYLGANALSAVKPKIENHLEVEIEVAL